RGGKSKPSAALRTANDAALDAVGSSQHSSGEINPPVLQELAYATGADSPSPQTHFRHFVGAKSQTIAYLPQQLYVAFTIVAKGKAAAEIDFFCMQTIYNDVAQKIPRANLCERLIKVNHDRLLDAEHTEGFDLLIESLQ